MARRKNRGGKERTGHRKEITPSHDTFFKALIQYDENANIFVRERLPVEIIELLGPEPPEVMPGSFIDTNMRQQHSDVLLKMRLKDGEPFFVYILLEHKSKAEPLTRMQIFRYCSRVLDKWYDEHPEKPMPVVVPVVVYCGLSPWPYPTQLTELAGVVPGAIRRHMISMDHLLVDLTLIDDSDLSRDVGLRTALVALKHGKRQDLSLHLEPLTKGLREMAAAPRRGLLVYIIARVGYDAVERSMQEYAPELLEELEDHPLWEKGWESGLEIGEEKGRRSALAESVLRIAEVRFAAPSEEIRKRIAAADEVTLQEWLMRLIQAASLDEVFGAAEGLAEDDASNHTLRVERLYKQRNRMKISREARRQGLASALLRVLEKRFPPIPDEAHRRISGAGIPELELWLDRAVEASSLDAVLADAENAG